MLEATLLGVEDLELITDDDLEVLNDEDFELLNDEDLEVLNDEALLDDGRTAGTISIQLKFQPAVAA